MIIKCLLCNRFCAEIAQPDYFTQHKFHCKKHPYTLHYYTTNFKEYICNFYVDYRNEKYRVQYEFIGGKVSCCEISYLTNDPPGNDGTTFKVYRKTLCNFSGPHVTPENVEQKLPTILVFS